MEIIELDPFDPIGVHAIAHIIHNCLSLHAEDDNVLEETVITVLRRIQSMRSGFMFNPIPAYSKGTSVDPMIFKIYYPYVKQQVGIAIVDAALSGEN